MSTSAEVVWGNTEIKDATKNLKYNAAGVASACVKITNATIYELDIASTGYGSSIDKIPPMCAIITENPVEFTLTLDVAAGSGIPVVAEMNQSVSLTYINSQVPYQIIPLSNLNIGTLTTINLNGGSVEISGGSVEVSGGSITSTIDTSGGPVETAGTITNAVDVNQIVQDVTTQSTVTNVSLSTNPGFEAVVNEPWDVSFAAAGDNVIRNFSLANNANLLDRCYVTIYSPGGYLDDYSVYGNLFWNQGQSSSLYYGEIEATRMSGSNSTYATFEINFSSLSANGLPANNIALILASSVAVTETVVLSLFARYASAEIANPIDRPANTLVPSYQFNAVTNGTITTGGTAQTMVGSNSSRRHLVIYNTNTNGNGDILWVQFTDTAGVNKGFPIGPGFNRDFAADDIPTNAISIYGATTGDTYAYEEA